MAEARNHMMKRAWDRLVVEHSAIPNLGASGPRKTITAKVPRREVCVWFS